MEMDRSALQVELYEIIDSLHVHDRQYCEYSFDPLQLQPSPSQLLQRNNF